ncbi:MAG TPA: hypothetical protein VGW38_00505, partial [Chloroflexota bacterium]|nr:hypothetical protein [Chloroflexota bacterium]
IALTVPSRWMQVVWRPLLAAGSTAGEAAMPSPLNAEDSSWLIQPRFEVRYDVRWLGLKQDSRKPKEEREQLLAAFRTAFTILVYTAMFCLLRRLSRNVGADRESQDRLTVQMLRIQQRGREAGPMDGDQGVFAAAQAVELALNRDFDVRLSGLVVGDTDRVGKASFDGQRLTTADRSVRAKKTAKDIGYTQRDAAREKRRGLYSAMISGFPLVIERHGTTALEPAIGLISYASRPCNDHPEQSGKRSMSLCSARTYLATAVSDPLWGYRIQNEAGLTEIREERDMDSLPSVVVEEIRRLYEVRGCRHIMVLAHRYGTRRIGWAAARMRSPEFPKHLADVAARYSDLSLYPLVRDSFPVTRLRRRGEGEDAFEILQPDEHLHAYSEAARDLRYAYSPVYSLATLHVVGEQRKPQSGFCTYFLLRDGGAGSIEMAEQIRANLLLSTSPVRLDLIAVLRGVHYLESERTPTKGGTLQPVLDPYRWMLPETIGHAGEVVVSTSRRRAGTIVLSLPAALDHVSRVLHAQL